MQRDLDKIGQVRELARHVMLADSAAGVAIGAWRGAVLMMCRHYGVEEPNDVLAWVSDGKASDADVTDWDSTFAVA